MFEGLVYYTFWQRELLMNEIEYKIIVIYYGLINCVSMLRAMILN